MKRLYLLLISFCLIGCNQPETNKHYKEQHYVDTEHEYSEIKQYELSWETMFDVESENYYVYIYSLICSHCQEIKNNIIETALKQKNIYFVKSSSKDQIAKDENIPKNAENPGEIWILGYPTLLKIVNKICVKNSAGTTEILNELK